MLRIPYNLDATSYYYDISNKSYAQIYGYPSLFDIDASDIVLGEYPQNEGECTIDQSFVDEIREVYSLREITDDDILGSTIRVADFGGQAIMTLTIVGVTDMGSFRVTLDETHGPRLASEIMAAANSYTDRPGYIASRLSTYTYEEKTPVGLVSVGSVSATLPNVWVSRAYYDLAPRMGDDTVNVIGYYPEDAMEIVLATEDDVNLYMQSDGLALDKIAFGSLEEIDGATLTHGRLPAAFKEVVVSDYLYDSGNTLSGYTIVGSVETSFNERLSWFSLPSTIEYRTMSLMGRLSIPLSPEHTLDDHLVPSDLFLSNDLDLTIDYFTTLGHHAYRYGTYVNTEFLAATLAQNRAFVITFAIMFAIVVLLFYLTTRSKMIKNIYPIGVYRSLGAKRGKIMRLFLSDNVIQATFTNVASFTVVSILLTSILSNLGMDGMPFWVFLIGIVFSYAIPFFGTWLPLAQLLSKTPNQITTKYDI